MIRAYLPAAARAVSVAVRLAGRRLRQLREGIYLFSASSSPTVPRRMRTSSPPTRRFLLRRRPRGGRATPAGRARATGHGPSSPSPSDGSPRAGAGVRRRPGHPPDAVDAPRARDAHAREPRGAAGHGRGAARGARAHGDRRRSVAGTAIEFKWPFLLPGRCSPAWQPPGCRFLAAFLATFGVGPDCRSAVRRRPRRPARRRPAGDQLALVDTVAGLSSRRHGTSGRSFSWPGSPWCAAPAARSAVSCAP